MFQLPNLPQPLSTLWYRTGACTDPANAEEISIHRTWHRVTQTQGTALRTEGGWTDWEQPSGEWPEDPGRWNIRYMMAMCALCPSLHEEKPSPGQGRGFSPSSCSPQTPCPRAVSSSRAPSAQTCPSAWTGGSPKCWGLRHLSYEKRMRQLGLLS